MGRRSGKPKSRWGRKQEFEKTEKTGAMEVVCFHRLALFREGRLQRLRLAAQIAS